MNVVRVLHFYSRDSLSPLCDELMIFALCAASVKDSLADIL